MGSREKTVLGEFGISSFFFTRRGFIGASTASASLALFGCQTTGPQMPADTGPDPSRPVSVLYIRSDSCPYCRRWEAVAEQRWLASDTRPKVVYRVLDFPHFRDISGDDGWPADLRWVREQEGLKRGTPRYIVIRDREVLISEYGTASWLNDVLPLIRREVS